MPQGSSLIGKIINHKLIKVEQSLIRRFNNSLGPLEATPMANAPELSEKDAENTVPLVALPIFGEYEKLYNILNVRAEKLLHSRETIISWSPIKVGDNLHIYTILNDLYEQQASSTPMGFIEISILGKKKRRFVFRCSRITAVRGGFKRG